MGGLLSQNNNKLNCISTVYRVVHCLVYFVVYFSGDIISALWPRQTSFLFVEVNLLCKFYFTQEESILGIAIFHVYWCFCVQERTRQ